MLTAWYIGDHSKDDLLARVGYFLIRLGQVGQLHEKVTHCEGILRGTWDHCTLAGASKRDGSRVRIKTTALSKGNWVILDVPAWDVERFSERFGDMAGTPYSDLGAMSSASMLVGILLKVFRIRVSELGQWCSRTLLECNSVSGAEDMNVSEAMTVALALTGTKDITTEFFSGDNNV